MKTTPFPQRLPRLPHLALAALTVVTFFGPFSLLIVWGGASATWPPDRPIEWLVVIGVPVLAFSLMAACVFVPLWYPASRWHQTPPSGSTSK